MERIITKTPGELDLLTINYAAGLPSDYINSGSPANVWAASDPSIVLSNPAIFGSPAQSAGVWCTGGEVGNVYYLDNEVTSAAGRVLKESIKLFIVQYNFLDDIISKGVEQSADYTMDWSEDLTTGDTITASTWSSSDPGLSVNYKPAFIDSDNVSATVWLSGGVIGSVYYVTNRITTSLGRILEKSIKVCVIAHSSVDQSAFYY